MYQISVDDYILHDARSEDLFVIKPKCKLKENTVGEASFTVLSIHPFYAKMNKLKSIFSIKEGNETIFRGIMTDDSYDFDNQKAVVLEGVLSFANDSLIPPFNFPEDFLEDADYITAAESGNVVEFFLNWAISQHNEQTLEFQHFKLGNVTVSDPNNYVTRSSESFLSLWEILKSRLFDSELGGKLCIRYEEDGNYIDYLSKYELTNTQRIKYGENLLDLLHESDAKSTYSAILPLGAEIETEDGTKKQLTLESLADGELTSDLVKKGKFIYSKSAVEQYGWKCVPLSESTWKDVTEVENLKTKSMNQLAGDAVKFSDTITAKAVDLHITDEEIQSFRIYRNIIVDSLPHGVDEESFELSELDIDMENVQNTKITVGKTVRTMSEIHGQQQSSNINRIESAFKDIEANRSEMSEVKNQMVILNTEVVNTCEEVIFSALKSYVETSSFSEFVSTLESELKVWAEGIAGRVTAAETDIQNVDGDLQEKFNEITKWFTFAIDGLTIGQVDNPYKIVLDNDRYSMFVNEVEVLWIDAITREVHTPEITITDRVKALGYLIEEDSEGNVNCDYIGGEY